MEVLEKTAANGGVQEDKELPVNEAIGAAVTVIFRTVSCEHPLASVTPNDTGLLTPAVAYV